MKEPRRQVVALHSETRLRRRMRALREQGIEVRFVEDWEDLWAVAREASPATLLLVDPYHPERDRPATALQDLLRRFPSLVVLATLPRGASAADICALGQWGVADVVQLEMEDSERLLLRRLRQVRARPLVALLRGEGPGPLSVRARAILETAVDVALDGGYPSDMAERMHMDGSTLRRWCDNAGLPPPRRLLLWMRALLASMLLDDPGRTVLSAALACGYNSDQALRRALRRTLPRTPTELREEGAFDAVANAFHSEVLRPSNRESSS